MIHVAPQVCRFARSVTILGGDCDNLRRQMGLIEQLDILSRYFEENRGSYALSHHGKYVLIHEFKEVDFFDSAVLAYRHAKSLGLPSGKFLIRECVRKDEELPIIIHHRVLLPHERNMA